MECGRWTVGRRAAKSRAVTRTRSRGDAPRHPSSSGSAAAVANGAQLREAQVEADRLVGTASRDAAAVHARGPASRSVFRPPTWRSSAGHRSSCSAGSCDGGGAVLSERIAPHRLLALSASLDKLWPPGPLAIASDPRSGRWSRRWWPAAAGSTAMTILDDVLGARGRAVMFPLELGQGRVLPRQLPALSRRNARN